MTVLAFPPRPPEGKIVWRCSCGCLSFTLLARGEAVCQMCGALARGPVGDWRKELPEPSGDVPPPGLGDRTVTKLDSSYAALRRTLNKASADRTAAVIVLQDNGDVGTWGRMDTDEESAWLDHRLAVAREMLTRKRI